jgi:ferritin-like metal-binding protein YciE
MPRGKKSKRKVKNSTRSAEPGEMTLNEKMALYLNDALAIENAAIPRIQSRIKETSLEPAREQLRHHLEETKEQQNRLKQLIINLGGKPTNDKARLPVAAPPQRLANSMKSFVPAEQELKHAKDDAVIENAEVVMYDTLMQLAQQMGISDAIPALAQNLTEEREMADWIRTNTPMIITELYPQIESSVGEPPKEAEAA